MDYPFYIEGIRRGTLTVEEGGAGTDLSVRCVDDGRGIYRCAAVGTLGRLEMGVLSPGPGGLSARRVLRDTDALGVPLRGEGWLSYRFSDSGEAWRRAEHPEELFSDPLLRAAAMPISDARVLEGAERRLLAVPWSPHQTFALAPAFCFARIRRVGGTLCAVFAVDRAGRPVMDSAR